MMKTKLIFLIALLLLVYPLSSLALQSSQEYIGASVYTAELEDVLYVGGDGPNNYTGIQDAINDAGDGYMIYVYYGIYQENIVVNKSVSLIGISENDEKPIINTSENRNTVSIIADDCVFQGFLVKSRQEFTDENSPACYMHTNDSIIENNTFMYGKYTCYMHKSSRNTIRYNKFVGGYLIGLKTYEGRYNTIAYNIAQDNHALEGLYLYETNSNILGNTATNNTHGMSFDDASNCTISFNQIYENIQYGMTSDDSTHLSIANNTIHSHQYGGILMMDCSNCTIRDNELYDNQWGVSLEGRWRLPWCKNKYNTVIHNSIHDNGLGIFLEDGWRNSFIENDIINNDVNARFSLVLFFEDQNPSRPFYNEWNANYWSDWEKSFPKPIPGYVEVTFQSFSLSLPWRMYDTNPADEPYDW